MAPTVSPRLVVVSCPANSGDFVAQLVARLPATFAAPVIVVPGAHATPDVLADVLRAQSALPVRAVRDRAQLRPGNVFVVAGEQTAEVDGEEIRSTVRRSRRARPLEHLIASAAHSYRDRLITVIFPGTDGKIATLARVVKDAGGTILVAAPAARDAGSAIALIPTAVDATGDLDQIGQVLQDLVSASQTRPDADDVPTNAPPVVKSGRVTEFFHDPELFGYLQATLLPELVARAGTRGQELRIWSAGCATGDEVYSTAILLAEVLGDEFPRFSIRIFATDLDEDAIQFARRGIYPAAALGALTPERLERFFVRTHGAYEVSRHIRSLIIFGQHDLGRRAPFPRTDLVLCGDVLLSLDPELRLRALQLFAFSLREGGFLVTGAKGVVEPPAELFAAEPRAPRNERFTVYFRHGDPVIVIPTHPSLAQSAVWTAVHGGALHPAPQREASRADPRPAVRPDLVLENLPAGVVVVDRRYHIQAINIAARRMLGLHTATLDDDFLHLVERLNVSELRAAIDAALQGMTSTHLCEVDPGRRAGSTDDHLQITCVPTARDGGKTVAVTVLVEDRTDLVRERDEIRVVLTRERVIAEEAARFRDAADARRTEMAELNEQLSLINLELQSSNEELTVERQQAVAAMEEIETLNEELQATNEELEALSEEQKVTVAELNHANRDLAHRAEQAQHLTESLDRQRRASETERARLSAVLLSVGDPIVVVDSTGASVLANPAYERTFGSGGGPFLALDASGRLLSAEEHPLNRAARGESFVLEFTTVGPGGVRRRCEATGEPVPASGGERGVLVIRDVTERGIYRVQDEFMALASHELRTPLSAVMIYLELLEQRSQNRAELEEFHRFAERALHQAQRLKDLTGDLLDAARLQHGKLSLRMRSTDLGATVERAVEAAQTKQSAPVVRVTRPPELIAIQADPSRIEQVVLNLLNNALAHSADSEEIPVLLERKDPWAEIVVRDFGEGINPDELPFVFDRFRQVQSDGDVSGEGLGLGLYIAREIIVAHGGTIAVDSELGHGTTFTVRLPLPRDAELVSA